MNIVTQFLHTRLRVNDLSQSISFYTRVLGLEESRRKISPQGAELVFLRIPGSDIEIELAAFANSQPVPVPADLMHLAFRVQDMSAFAKHIESLSIPFSDPPHSMPSGNVIAFIDDPDGFEIELIESAK